MKIQTALLRTMTSLMTSLPLQANQTAAAKATDAAAKEIEAAAPGKGEAATPASGWGEAFLKVGCTFSPAVTLLDQATFVSALACCPIARYPTSSWLPSVWWLPVPATAFPPSLHSTAFPPSLHCFPLLLLVLPRRTNRQHPRQQMLLPRTLLQRAERPRQLLLRLFLRQLLLHLHRPPPAGEMPSSRSEMGRGGGGEGAAGPGERSGNESGARSKRHQQHKFFSFLASETT